jgi:hypothetical protein
MLMNEKQIAIGAGEEAERKVSPKAVLRGSTCKTLPLNPKGEKLWNLSLSFIALC